MALVSDKLRVLADQLSEIDKLKKELVDAEGGWRIKVYETHEKYQKNLPRLIRMLKEALDGTKTDPPWIKLIVERLEDSIDIVDAMIKIPH